MIRAIYRRAAKRLLLWLNARQRAESDAEIMRLCAMRADVDKLAGDQHLRQVRLIIRGNELARW